MKLAAIFNPEPIQWGLRGDPYLWSEMKVRLAGMLMPSTESKLKKILEGEFQFITGHPVSHQQTVVVDRFKGGGMSSGMVSPAFWQDTVIPLLLDRFKDLRFQK